MLFGVTCQDLQSCIKGMSSQIKYDVRTHPCSLICRQFSVNCFSASVFGQQKM